MGTLTMYSSKCSSFCGENTKHFFFTWYLCLAIYFQLVFSFLCLSLPAVGLLGASDQPQGSFFETNIKDGGEPVEGTKEEEEAAVRIQAAFKGYTTRRALKERPNKDSFHLPNWHGRISEPPGISINMDLDMMDPAEMEKDSG